MIYNKEYRGIVIGNVWNENKAAFSRLSDFARSSETPAQVIGIKYVIKGRENYSIDHKTYSVKNDCFFLVNPNRKFEMILDDQEPTTGICINLEKKVLADVFNNYSSPEKLLLEEEQSNLIDFDFPETIYQPDDHFSQYLSLLKNYIDQNTGKLMIEKEKLYYDVAKNLLLAQSFIRKQVLQIKANKKATREELFRRVNEARAIIDDTLQKPMEIGAIASSVALSEFHFFRIFKQVYGITPHQYQIKQRLEKAKQQIIKGFSITEAAETNGFADVYSFSKSFKKGFGFSPGQLRK
ncbi:MAG TPA: AraC family transcriptional regulator [Bacteroidia bacterium]